MGVERLAFPKSFRRRPRLTERERDALVERLAFPKSFRRHVPLSTNLGIGR